MGWTESKLLDRIAVAEVLQEEHRRQLSEIRQRLAAADARRNALPLEERFRANPLLNGLEKELDRIKALLTEDEQTIKLMQRRLESLRRGEQIEEDLPPQCSILKNLAEETASLLDGEEEKDASPDEPASSDVPASLENQHAVLKSALDKVNLHDLAGLTGIEIVMLRLCQAGLNQRHRLSLREERLKNLLNATMKVIDRQKTPITPLVRRGLTELSPSGSSPASTPSTVVKPTK